MTSKCGEFFETRRPLKIVGMVIGGIILAGLMAFLFGWVVMLLWNWIMPAVFGVATITYWQGFGIFFLAKILFGFGGDSHSSTSGSKKKKPSEELSEKKSRKKSGRNSEKSSIKSVKTNLKKNSPKSSMKIMTTSMKTGGRLKAKLLLNNI